MTQSLESVTAVVFGSLASEMHTQVGGKCASLATMSQAGMPVPPGFAVLTEVFADAKAASGLMPALVDLVAHIHPEDQAALKAGAEAAREIVLSWEIPERHENCIRRMYDDLSTLSGLDEVPVAVRSSATVEGSPDASFAGEHDTYLWVVGVDNVLDRIKACCTVPVTRGTSTSDPDASPPVRRRVRCRESCSMSAAVRSMPPAST